MTYGSLSLLDHLRGGRSTLCDGQQEYDLWRATLELWSMSCPR
eukprot:CAMPEP_0204906150 /NCGR_PEP_ID=MMETSP1397-20131031/5821_1 /ASSEMBLY_ACC=CAM_ASM_000891 /TAXON_ID=49980 /ORGANISM="Climacostomum Climacostomum virens, Strain Stock W-24" /LENGTH=42 /DNA_ID= /DNA_START= /DNA_END= /DNA_ORIENTATION=